jgi:hypothetical protein
MRAGIGLLSILIAVAIILFVAFSGPKGGYIPAVVSAGSVAQSQAQQLSGQDENGMRAQDSIAMEEADAGGQLRGLTITAIIPTGPMATAYGLLKGDEIVQVGPMRLRDMNNDAELAKAMVFESYQRNEPLLVLRNGQELTISPDSALTANHPNLFAAPGTAVTGTAPLPPANAIQSQTQNVPTH